MTRLKVVCFKRYFIIFSHQQKIDLRSLERGLTFRYAIALVLIGCVILASYFVLVHKISDQEKDAYVINISGMQRMLSQRIALMSRETYHAENSAEAKIYVEKMRAALLKMQENHRQLSSGVYDEDHIQKFSPALRALYDGPNGIDAQVRAYTDAATRFLEAYDRGGLTAVQQNGDVYEIVATARNGLLDQLNEAVFQYQLEAEAKTARFKQLETVFVCVAFLTLFAAALFIFRPMVRKIVGATGELRSANAELLEFSYRISHDLRAPVVSSRGLIDVARSGAKDKKYDVVDDAMKHAGLLMVRLESLIDDIINLTKMKMIDCPVERLDLNEMIEDALVSIQNMPHFEKVKINVECNVKGAFGGYRLFLQQILENLISNAVKYHDPDEKPPHIVIKVRKDGEDIYVSVEDNGLGIPEDRRDRVFGMFQRFHPRVSFGSGLGLYLVAKNAQHLGGHIEYRALDKGSAFDLFFKAKSLNEQEKI